MSIKTCMIPALDERISHKYENSTDKWHRVSAKAYFSVPGCGSIRLDSGSDREDELDGSISF
jgi:hypothetical protein